MIESLIQNLKRFMPLSDDDTRDVTESVELCTFKKKQCITEIGEVENYIYFIVSGLARIYFYREKEEVNKHIVKEGEIITSAASFFSRKPSRYRIETIEPMTTYRLSRKKLEERFAVSNKWEQAGRLVTSYFLLEQELQILDSIRLSVRQRFVKFVTENSDLILRVPQKHLASYLNIKQETFSRMKHLMLEKQTKKVLNH